MNTKFLGITLSALMFGLSSAAVVEAKDKDKNTDGRHDNGNHYGWFKQKQKDNQSWRFDDDNDRNWRGNQSWRFDDGDDRWRNGRDWNNRNFNRSNSAAARAISAFDSRVASMRANIAAQLASGRINATQAARLNARLDSLLSTRATLAASGGVLTSNELALLNSRLGSLQVALRNRVWF